jgi:predicted ATP-grasp superfamily ATP-dependent carboligase
MSKIARSLPPVVILGGCQNALSIARNLGRRGIRVFAVNDFGEPVHDSRFCTPLPMPWEGDHNVTWANYLLGPEAEKLRGAVLLAAGDDAIEIITDHRSQLAERFLLDDSNPDAQRAMLDKLLTYQAAQAAGVPTPRFWVTGDQRSLKDLREELVYPLLVKPLSSHRFTHKFSGKKFLLAHCFEQLQDGLAKAEEAGLAVMLVEQVPGPDDRLCSYYTYLDGQGQPLYDFTKRVIRRFPIGMGNGCYHVTDRVPEVREPALRLFQHVGLRGLANAEFKWDERDGKHKLIECNARFTAADCLLARAGHDLASFVYNRIVGLPQPPLPPCPVGLRLWYPGQDFQAFFELRRQGQLSFWGWLSSIAHRQTLPYWQWNDPWPSLARWARALRLNTLYRGLRKGWRILRKVLPATSTRNTSGAAPIEGANTSDICRGRETEYPGHAFPNGSLGTR